MLFQDEHIAAIRDGTKTATRRDWADGYHPPSEGDVRMATMEMFTSDEDCDCYIRVTEHYKERLGDIDHEDAQKEGGCDIENFREAWIEINGEWNPDPVVDVVEFEYIGHERPGVIA